MTSARTRAPTGGRLRAPRPRLLLAGALALPALALPALALPALALPPLALPALSPPALARVLQVGPGAAYALPSQAVAAAGPGDRIEVAPGRYEDCAVIGQDGLVLEGSGPGVVLEGRLCQGKAILVVDGRGVTLRTLTLQGARNAEGNAAGVRAEGGDLLVAQLRFLDDQDGLLTAADPRATVTVQDSEFVGDGACVEACAHGIYAGHVARLVVRGSRFRDIREGHAIKSRARVTQVLDSDIGDGPQGTSSYLIDVPEGGDVLIAGNRLEKGPHSSNPGTAIMVGEEGADLPTPQLVVRDNRLANDQGRATTLLRNFTATPAQLSGNSVTGPVRPLAEGWLDTAAYRMRTGLRAAVRLVLRRLAGEAGRGSPGRASPGGGSAGRASTGRGSPAGGSEGR